MIGIVFSFFLAFSESSASELTAETVLVSSIEINATPTYFFKPSPDGRYYGYTTWKPSDGTEDKNIILDSQSGVSLTIPGTYDPVFTLNLRNVVVPHAVNGLRFFSVDELITKQKDATHTYLDKDFTGVYESVGIISQSNDAIVYRILIEKGGKRFYRDYKESINAAGQTEKIEPADEIKPVCNNYNFALPMISKNGKEFAGLDHAAGKSRVYSLNGDGSCTVVEELGHLTGKIAFSYTKRYIAYHVFAKADTLGQFAFKHISVPPTTTTANIYLKDRDSNLTYKLTNYVDGNAMYPEFLENGDLVYVLYPHNRNEHKPRFIRVTPQIP